MTLDLRASWRNARMRMPREDPNSSDQNRLAEERFRGSVASRTSPAKQLPVFDQPVVLVEEDSPDDFLLMAGISRQQVLRYRRRPIQQPPLRHLGPKHPLGQLQGSAKAGSGEGRVGEGGFDGGAKSGKATGASEEIHGVLGIDPPR